MLKDSFFNPSSHGPFFPRHDTASGHIEPGISGHMRPDHVTSYPFSPPPHLQLSQGPRHSLYWHHKFQYLFMLPAKLAIIYRNIFAFFICLKKHSSFGLLVAMSWALTPPAHKICTVTKSCMRQVRTGGAMTWQVLFFLPRMAGFSQPRSPMTWIFGVLVLFAE